MWSNEPVGQTLSSPEAWAAPAAILHKLTAVIQLDSNRLHSSSMSLVCWEGNGYTIGKRLPLRSCCSSWEIASATELYWHTFARRLLISCWNESSSVAVIFPRDTKYLLWTAMRAWTACQGIQNRCSSDISPSRHECSPQFQNIFDFKYGRNPAYLWVVRKGVCEGVGGLWEESAGTVGDQRGCSSDQGDARQVFDLKQVREEIH